MRAHLPTFTTFPSFYPLFSTSLHLLTSAFPLCGHFSAWWFNCNAEAALAKADTLLTPSRLLSSPLLPLSLSLLFPSLSLHPLPAFCSVFPSLHCTVICDFYKVFAALACVSCCAFFGLCQRRHVTFARHLTDTCRLPRHPRQPPGNYTHPSLSLSLLFIPCYNAYTPCKTV